MDYDNFLITKRSEGDINFINGKPYSDKYYENVEKWAELPLYKNKNKLKEFLNLLETKNVILLTSGTGSGKTVIVPKLLLKYKKLHKIKGKILVTNPKILTTESNAVYSAETLDVILGEEIGYTFKGKNKTTENTDLIYATDGTLLSIILKKDNMLSDFYAIIIDEAHERHIQIDLLLYFIKEIILKNEKFKLIIMSATINASVFKEYFNIPNIKYGEIDVHGASNHEITHNWAKKNITNTNYLEHAINKVNDILKTKYTGDILIFVPTQNDTLKGCKMITKTNKKIFCVEVFSNMNEENKELAISKSLYNKKGNYDVKIIFATNVAESSITFDGLKYVIDTGLELSSTFNASNNSTVVDIHYITRAQAIQRFGRSGRVSPGIAYHLYSKHKYYELQEYPKPGILTIDLTLHILLIINYNKSIETLNTVLHKMITPPTEIQIQNSLHKLEYINCLNKKENIISEIGSFILSLNIENIFLSYGVLLSYYIKCQKEFVILASILEITKGKLNTLFTTNDKKILATFRKISIPNSDHLTLLALYKYYKDNNIEYLKIGTFKKINLLINKLWRKARQLNKDEYYNINKKYNLLTDDEIDSYENIEDSFEKVFFILKKCCKYNTVIKTKTVNFMNTSDGLVNFYDITKKNKVNTFSDKFIFYDLSTIFGTNKFTCVTHI